MKKEEQDQITLQNSILDTTSFSDSLKIPNQTGKLMFKFDDDEPEEIASIYDYAKVIIEIQQQKGSNNNFSQKSTSIEFTSKNNKKFSLFIENCI